MLLTGAARLASERCSAALHAPRCATLQVVTEQITLWERELRRLGSRRATMYSNFESQELYERTAAFAQRLGVVLFRSDAQRWLVVQAEAHEHVRAEIRSLKQQLGV